MNAFVALLIGVLVAVLGYKMYAQRIDRSVIGADARKATPATMFMDGVDFAPASKNVLFGYQFKSIAALGPIIGPIVAAQWGWLPGLLWILGGCLLIGWVQDYSSTMVALRNEGMTFGGLSYKLISPRSRIILLSFIYFYLLLILGAFGAIVAGPGLMGNPRVPTGIIVMTLAGLLAGQMIYRWKKDIILTTVITVAICFVGIWLGTQQFMIDLFTAINGGATPPKLWEGVDQRMFIWAIIGLAFCYLGAVLPIWRFAQPVNFVAFWIVALGIVGGCLGVLIWRPSFGDFPAFSGFWVKGILGAGIETPLWPFLFVTIACSAVSGWHSLVSSSGTSRQIEKETDSLPVAGGSMFAESILGILSLITAAGVWGSFAGYKAQLAKGAGAVFAGGLGKLLSYIGVPESFGVAFGAVFLVIMAITVMQLVLRFMRVASAEFVGDIFPAMKNMYLGSIVGVILALLLIFTGFWQRIWILFGGANQLMGALALLIVTVWLITQGKPYRWAFYPFIFLYITTLGALLYTAYATFNAAVNAAPNASGVIIFGNYLAGAIGLFLAIAALVLAWDGFKAIQRARATRRPAMATATGS